MAKPLLTDFPAVARHWDTEKNSEIDLSDITIGSDKKVWWIGDCHHEWQQQINRQVQKNFCPYCSGKKFLAGVNDLTVTHPHLVVLWDEVANSCLASEVIYRDKSIAYWKCSLGHGWKSPMKSIQGGKEPCPFCGNRELLSGFNDLKTLHPEIINEWDVEGNQESPSEVLFNTVRTYQWICPNSHIYSASAYNRSRGRGCPVCSGKQVATGLNDVASLYPELLMEWDTTVPGNIPLAQLTAGSNKIVHWVCSEGHQYEQNMAAKIRGRGCAICAGKQILTGYNDMATTHPVIADEWHPTKNAPLAPTQVRAGSHQKIWWLGKCGHEWQAALYHRTGNGRGCAVCAGKQAVVGFNDALSIAPAHIINEYDNSKNELSLAEYVKGSEKKVWWKCTRGHEWEARIRNRIHLEHNCPQCNTNVSKAEKEIADHLTSLIPDVQTSVRNVIDRFELDMYIPSKNIAIEYNGVHWHSNANPKMTKTYHHDKWLACKDKGIQLIQIWEDEWNRNPEQIKRMLAHKLGISNERKVFARKTTVVELNKAQSEPFLNENHVQGYASGSYYLGLKDKGTDELVSVLVLKKEGGSEGKVLNIIRYATSANVVGGFTKLLSYATKTYQPDSYLTFSDHCVSDGGLYANHGFIADKELPPDYMYVVGNVRKHKFGYRLKRFKDDPALLWEEGLTERELADLNGLKRIWDAGKTRWVLEV